MRPEAPRFIRVIATLTTSVALLGGCSTFEGISDFLPSINSGPGSKAQISRLRTLSKGDGSDTKTWLAPEYDFGNPLGSAQRLDGEGLESELSPAAGEVGYLILKENGQNAHKDASSQQPATRVSIATALPDSGSRIGEPDTGKPSSNLASAEVLERLRARSIALLSEAGAKRPEAAARSTDRNVTLPKLPVIEIDPGSNGQVALQSPPDQTTNPMSDSWAAPESATENPPGSRLRLSGKGLEAELSPSAGDNRYQAGQKIDPGSDRVRSSRQPVEQIESFDDLSNPVWRIGEPEAAIELSRPASPKVLSRLRARSPDLPTESRPDSADLAATTIDLDNGPREAAQAGESTFPANETKVPPRPGPENLFASTRISEPNSQSAALPPQLLHQDRHSLLLFDDEINQSKIDLQIIFSEDGVLLSGTDKDRLKFQIQQLREFQRKIEIFAYASSSLRTNSEARRLALKRLFAVRDFLIREGIPMELTILRAFSNPTPSLFADRVDVIAFPTGRTVGLGNSGSTLGQEGTENSEATDSGNAFSENQAQGRGLSNEFEDADDRSASPSSALAAAAGPTSRVLRDGRIQLMTVRTGATASRSPPVPAPPIIEVMQRPIQPLAHQTKGKSSTTAD